MIAGLTLMMECYLVTDDDHETLNSNNGDFLWLVKALDCAVEGQPYCGLEFAVIEVVEVIYRVAT